MRAIPNKSQNTGKQKIKAAAAYLVFLFLTIILHNFPFVESAKSVWSAMETEVFNKRFIAKDQHRLKKYCKNYNMKKYNV